MHTIIIGNDLFWFLLEYLISICLRILVHKYTKILVKPLFFLALLVLITVNTVQVKRRDLLFRPTLYIEQV